MLASILLQNGTMNSSKVIFWKLVAISLVVATSAYLHGDVYEDLEPYDSDYMEADDDFAQAQKRFMLGLGVPKSHNKKKFFLGLGVPRKLHLQHR
ncbi:unnamed protein product [Mesocestoides corti]|uniref:Venom peptide n=1 Tax=Mesocestoides corti TaxID=53468 RepID=A0A0R3UIY0_MESCO|nr:unnamed protein product [Mesocestoides corti]